MNKPWVYIETTIPSFYFEMRIAADITTMRRATRLWWERHRRHFRLCTSEIVLHELFATPEPKRTKALRLLAKLKILELNAEVVEAGRAYMASKLMPSNPGADALHLALVSVHKVEYLLTWNCRHLANANKFRQIARMNERIGLYVPILTTPSLLIPERTYGP